MTQWKRPALAAVLLVPLLLALAGVYFLRQSEAYSIALPDFSFMPGESTVEYGAWPPLASVSFYATAKQQFIDQKASFIAADLSGMRISYYRDGVEAFSAPIKAKGRPGSWWETPAGLYKIELKEKAHFSTIGKVYQPWSMQFQGNFFIHGIPYYPSGEKTSNDFTGGCIKLADDDAQKLYELVANGTPVIVYDESGAKDGFQYQFDIPGVSAESYLVADLRNGTVLASKQANVRMPIASITKLVSALVVAEYVNLEKNITVPPEALVYTSKPRLQPGEVVRAYDLLFPMLTESSNEAAETFARTLGKNWFVGLMNKKAQAIGLTSSTFADASGASEGNVSTAEDLFALLHYLYENRRFVFSIASGSLTSSAYGEVAFTNLGNYNVVPLLPNEFIGGKIGKTNAALETYAGAFMIEARGEERPIAVVVLKSAEVYGDVRTLVHFVEQLY